MTRQETLAECVRQSRGLMLKQVAGFDEAGRTASAPNVPGHTAWCLGHCAYMMHIAAERVDGRMELGDDFLSGQADGDSRRFSVISVTTDAATGPAHAAFPSLQRCVEIFTTAADRLGAAILACPDMRLDDQVSIQGGIALPRWSVIPRATFRNGVMCGRIACLRHALGMPPVVW